MVTMDLTDPHQVDDVMAKQIKKHHHEALAPAGALQTMSDGLPAIGIVAAVLGVIKTMSSIDQPYCIGCHDWWRSRWYLFGGIFELLSGWANRLSSQSDCRGRYKFL